MERETTHILFVDDEPKLLEGFKRLLRPLGDRFEVHTAEGGESALDILFVMHAAVGAEIIARIPRLETVAEIVKHQFDAPVPDAETFDEETIPPDVTGGQLLRVALNYDRGRMAGDLHEAIVEEMKHTPDNFFRPFVDAMEHYSITEGKQKVNRLNLSELAIGKVLAADVRTSRDLLIATRGQEISSTMLRRMQAFHKTHKVREPILKTRDRPLFCVTNGA
ncbi:MAG: hypothetical protein MAG453_00340 [Calditrichaeota bacterium]|nr:hypothetical protein [Calditrichota bacterium]